MDERQNNKILLLKQNKTRNVSITMLTFDFDFKTFMAVIKFLCLFILESLNFGMYNTLHTITRYFWLK